MGFALSVRCIDVQVGCGYRVMFREYMHQDLRGLCKVTFYQV